MEIKTVYTTSGGKTHYTKGSEKTLCGRDASTSTGNNGHMCKRCEAKADKLRAQEQRDADCQAVNAMQDHCDVSYPDAPDSPGAVWLLNVHNGVQEAWDTGRFGEDSGEGADEVIWELAESVTPIYTHNVWQIFTDLCAYDHEAAEDGFTDGSPTEWAMGALNRIADQGMWSWLRNKREELACDECGEYPCECDDDDDDDAESDDTPRCTRCGAHVADAGLTGTLCGECTDRMHAETAPEPVCCLHCPDGCDGDHDAFCGHCEDGCC